MRNRNILLLIFLACLWGPSFLFIKVAVAEIPPITLVLGRVGLASIFVLVLLRAMRRPLPAPGRIWGHLAVVALFQNALPFVVLSWSEQYIDSALASILNGLTPIFTIILAHFLTTYDRLNPIKVIGVALGLAGSALLVAPSLLDGLQGTTWGSVGMIGVSASYGFALVYARKKLRGLPSLVAPASQLSLATLYLLPLALIIDRPFQGPLPSLQAIGSVVALAALGTGLAFIVYYRLLETAEASFVSMVTYLVPIVGVVLGVVVLGERLAWTDLIGFALILLGVAVVNNSFGRFFRNRILGQPKPLMEVDDRSLSQ